ncbi:MAG: endolytic transglycosylase MltG [Eubacterium sp.]|nr:endolytic transglycosylase MltG [Eubacterium sp.]
MILGVSLNVIVIAVGVFIIFTAGSKAYTFGHNIFDEEAVSSEAQARETQVTISDGITSKQLAKLLYDKGLVKDKTCFYYQIILSDYKDKFVGGTYTLNTAMTPTEMMKVLAGADTGEDK